MKKYIFLTLFFPLLLFFKTTKKDSLWLPLKLFIGKWIGEGRGEP